MTNLASLNLAKGHSVGKSRYYLVIPRGECSWTRAVLVVAVAGDLEYSVGIGASQMRLYWTKSHSLVSLTGYSTVAVAAAEYFLDTVA